MYKCKICGKEFDSALSYGGHMSGHSREGNSYPRNEKPKCLECGNSCSRNRDKFCSRDCSNKYREKHTYFRNMDITVHDLEEYRKNHLVCEICGREETMNIGGTKCNLAVDHDHNSNKFRGLLCYSCNTKLSWYENWKDKIDNYLE